MATELLAPALDATRIVEVLARHDTDVLPIGRLAGRYHGARRLTNDLDILVGREQLPVNPQSGSWSRARAD